MTPAPGRMLSGGSRRRSCRPAPQLLAEWIEQIRTSGRREAARGRVHRRRAATSSTRSRRSIVVDFLRPGGESLRARSPHHVTGGAPTRLTRAHRSGRWRSAPPARSPSLEAPGPRRVPSRGAARGLGRRRRAVRRAIEHRADVSVRSPGDASATLEDSWPPPALLASRCGSRCASSSAVRHSGSGIEADAASRVRGREPRRSSSAGRRQCLGATPRRSSARTVNPALPRCCCCAHSPPPAFGYATTATSTGPDSRSATSYTGDCPSRHGSSTVTPIYAPSPFTRMPHRWTGSPRPRASWDPEPFTEAMRRRWPADRRSELVADDPAGDDPVQAMTVRGTFDRAMAVIGLSDRRLSDELPAIRSEHEELVMVDLAITQVSSAMIDSGGSYVGLVR